MAKKFNQRNEEATQKVKLLRCQPKKKKKSNVNTKKAKRNNGEEKFHHKSEPPTLQICKGKREMKPSKNKKLMDVDQAIETHFQEEIIMDILTRLPVRSLLRFKSVSRFWKTLITDPYFKINHLSHAKNDESYQKFLVCQWGFNRDEMFKVYCSSLSSAQLVQDSQKLDFPPNCKPLSFRFYCCCDGLVLLSIANGIKERLLLWNPSTREVLVIPHPESPLKDYICGMAYDATTDDYKILMIDLNARERRRKVSIEIFTLKSGSWKKISNYPAGIRRVLNYLDCGMDSLAFAHGAFHWLGFSVVSSGYIVVSFSILNEVYRGIPLLEGMYNISTIGAEHGVSVLGGMLCFYSTYGSSGDFKLWVMKDYGVKKSWTILFTMRDTDLSSVRPTYMFADGEVLLSCKHMGHVGRVFKTTKKPFGLWSQHHDFLGGIVYTESLISPKLLT